MLWVRLTTQVDGVIVSSQDVPPSRGPRYGTEYVIRGSDGKDHAYVAGATDASLPRSMRIGTRLRKLRWQLGYERDVRRVDDFGIGFYVAVLAIGLGCIASSLALWRKGRSAD